MLLHMQSVKEYSDVKLNINIVMTQFLLSFLYIFEKKIEKTSKNVFSINLVNFSLFIIFFHSYVKNNKNNKKAKKTTKNMVRVEIGSIIENHKQK